MVGDYSEIQIKVRNMTNNDAWGVIPSEMHELVRELEFDDSKREIIETIRERWNDSTSTWRNIYKALTVYEYLILHGPESFIYCTRSEGRDAARLRELGSFQYSDSQGKDQGINVSTKASAILKLLQDDTTLGQSRQAALENRKTMLSRRGGNTCQEFSKKNSISKYGTPSSEPLSTYVMEGGSASGSEERLAQNSIIDDVQKTSFVNLIEIDSDRQPSSNDEFTRLNDEDDEFTEFQHAPAVASNAAKAETNSTSATIAETDLEKYLQSNSNLVNLDQL